MFVLFFEVWIFFFIMAAFVFSGHSASDAGLAALELGLLNSRDVTQAMLALGTRHFYNCATPSALRHMPVKCNCF